MTALPKDRQDACESVDSAVFSGDMLHVPEQRAAFGEYLERWARAMGYTLQPVPVEAKPEAHDGPRCGHSGCSQSYIDTGDPACVAPLWMVYVNGYRYASVRAETDDEAQDLALSGFDAEGDEVEWEDETTSVSVESND